MRDWIKTCLVSLLFHSICHWKNCTRAEALVHFFPRKIERINRPTRHVLLHSSPSFMSSRVSIVSIVVGELLCYNSCDMQWPWWRNQMETFFALLALCAGNSPVASEFPSQRPVRWSFDVFFDLHLNKRFSEQSWIWWFETPSSSL